jgi:hypothetical protein
MSLVASIQIIPFLEMLKMIKNFLKKNFSVKDDESLFEYFGIFGLLNKIFKIK